MASSAEVHSLFDQQPVIDQGDRKSEHARYITNQAFPGSANPVEISIETNVSALDSLIVLDRSYLDVKWKLMKDNTDVVSTAEPINYVKQLF